MFVPGDKRSLLREYYIYIILYVPSCTKIIMARRMVVVDIDDDIVRVHQLKSINHSSMIISILCAQMAIQLFHWPHLHFHPYQRGAMLSHALAAATFPHSLCSCAFSCGVPIATGNYFHFGE